MRKNMFLATAILALTSFEFSQAWLARPIPVFYDHDTDTFSLLLLKNHKTGQWSDFGEKAPKNTEKKYGPDVAQKALYDKSFGFYHSDNAFVEEKLSREVPSRQERGKNDIFYFVLVKEKLMPKDCRWFSEKEIANAANVSLGVKDLFASAHNIWPGVRKELTDLVAHR